MTCIVSFTRDNVMYMAGERGNSDSSIIMSSKTPKIFNINNYLVGYSGVSGQGQLIQHRFNFPTLSKDIDIVKYMCSEFAPALRTFFQSYEINTDKEEDCADIVVGIKGHIFEISTWDFQCVEYDLVAIGSGREYALGAYHALYDYDIDPQSMIGVCMNAALEYSPSCKGPIDILSVNVR